MLCIILLLLLEGYYKLHSFEGYYLLSLNYWGSICQNQTSHIDLKKKKLQHDFVKSYYQPVPDVLKFMIYM